MAMANGEYVPPSLEQREITDAMAELDALGRAPDHAGLVRIVRLALRISEITTHRLKKIEEAIESVRNAAAAAAAAAAKLESETGKGLFNGQVIPLPPLAHVLIKAASWPMAVIVIAVTLSIWRAKGWL